MAQYDFYGLPDGSYLLDCQADVLDELSTRFVIPLLNPQNAPKIVRGLNPHFVIGGEMFVLYTQFASSVPNTLLSKLAGSLESHHFEIVGAIDMLVSGY